RLSSLSILSFSRLPPPPRSSLFPYTTLFRSGEFPGDLAQGQLRSAELLRDELPGAMLGELPRGFLGVRARARQRLEVPAAGADRAAFDGLKAHALLQVRAERVEPLPGERREHDTRRAAPGVGQRHAH